MSDPTYKTLSREEKDSILRLIASFPLTQLPRFRSIDISINDHCSNVGFTVVATLTLRGYTFFEGSQMNVRGYEEPLFIDKYSVMEYDEVSVVVRDNQTGKDVCICSNIDDPIDAGKISTTAVERAQKICDLLNASDREQGG